MGARCDSEEGAVTTLRGMRTGFERQDAKAGLRETGA
jgi:hypothetical protein